MREQRQRHPRFRRPWLRRSSRFPRCRVREDPRRREGARPAGTCGSPWSGGRKEIRCSKSGSPLRGERALAGGREVKQPALRGRHPAVAGRRDRRAGPPRPCSPMPSARSAPPGRVRSESTSPCALMCTSTACCWDSACSRPIQTLSVPGSAAIAVTFAGAGRAADQRLFFGPVFGRQDVFELRRLRARTGRSPAAKCRSSRTATVNWPEVLSGPAAAHSVPSADERWR